MSISSIFILQATEPFLNAMFGTPIATTTVDVNLPYDVEERSIVLEVVPTGQQDGIPIPAGASGDYSIEMTHWSPISLELPEDYTLRITVSGISPVIAGTVTRIAFNEGVLGGGGEPN